MDRTQKERQMGLTFLKNAVFPTCQGCMGAVTPASLYVLRQTLPDRYDKVKNLGQGMKALSYLITSFTVIMTKRSMRSEKPIMFALE